MTEIIKKLFIISAFYEFERAFFISGWLTLRTDTPKPIIIMGDYFSYKNISITEFFSNIIFDEFVQLNRIEKIALQKHSHLEIVFKEKFKEENIFTYDFDNDLLHSISDVNDFAKSMTVENRLLVPDDFLKGLSLKHTKYCYLNFLQLCSEQMETLRLRWGRGEFEQYCRAMRQINTGIKYC